MKEIKLPPLGKGPVKIPSVKAVTKLSGPMFESAEDDERESIHKKEGGHYNIFFVKPNKAMGFLRRIFPEGEANEYNAVLFSTSGVHGCYTTIEEVEQDIRTFGSPPTSEELEERDDRTLWEVTFVLIQPRLVAMQYGNVEVTSLDDIKFLKKLRASSWKALSKIGAPE